MEQFKIIIVEDVALELKGTEGRFATTSPRPKSLELPTMK